MERCFNTFYCKCHDEQFHFDNLQDDMIEETTYPSNISNEESNLKIDNPAVKTYPC